MTVHRSDVVVVGGGAIGLASAWRLAQQGLAVTVVDPAPGSGASGVAAGMLAPITEARPGEEDQLRLNLASWSRWPAFAAEVEAALAAAGDTDGEAPEIGYRSDGTLVAALDADDRAALDDIVARQRSLGLEITTLRGREARALEPGLAPGVRAGALAAGERSVDPADGLHRQVRGAHVHAVGRHGDGDVRPVVDQARGARGPAPLGDHGGEPVAVGVGPVLEPDLQGRRAAVERGVGQLQRVDQHVQAPEPLPGAGSTGTGNPVRGTVAHGDPSWTRTVGAFR